MALGVTTLAIVVVGGYAATRLLRRPAARPQLAADLETRAELDEWPAANPA